MFVIIHHCYYARTKEDSETVTQCVLVEEGKEMEIVKTLTKEVEYLLIKIYC